MKTTCLPWWSHGIENIKTENYVNNVNRVYGSSRCHLGTAEELHDWISTIALPAAPFTVAVAVQPEKACVCLRDTESDELHMGVFMKRRRLGGNSSDK